jgi:hypothetical protein
MKKNIIFTEDTLLAEISFSKFFECLGGGTIESIIEKNKQSYEVKYMVKADSVE